MTGVPNVFANATVSIPLVQLDQNFNTQLTIGNTSVGLGNTVASLTGLTNVAAGNLSLITSLPPTSGGKPTNRYTNFTNSSSFATSSSSPVMGGFGSSWAITPATTGRVRVRITGWVNNSVAIDAVGFFLSYGTGAAPTQGAAATGTDGTTSEYIGTSGISDQIIPFAAEFEATGLTLSTAYWVDVKMRAVGSGTATMLPISVIIEEF